MSLLLRQTLRYLRVVGMDPTLQNRMSKILNFVAVLSIVIVFVPYLEEMVWFFEGFESLNRFEFIAVPILMIFLNFTFVQKRQEILDLIELRKRFWSAEDFDEKTQNKIFQTKCNTVKIIKFFLATFLFLPVMVVGVNLWKGNGKSFFLNYRKCTETMCYTIQLIFQLFVMYFACIPLAGTFVFFFGSLVSEIYCCLELLACGYRKITDSPDDLAQNLKRLVDQHILILRFTKAMGHMYSNVLLFVFFTFTVFYILCFNIIITSGASLPVLIQYAPLTIVGLCELLIFCAGGTIITEKFNSLSRAVSGIHWIDVGEERVRFGKDVSFILMVSQQTNTLTVGSVIPLNLNTFVKVLRVYYSVITLIAAFQK